VIGGVDEVTLLPIGGRERSFGTLLDALLLARFEAQHDVVVDLLIQAKSGGGDHERVYGHHDRHGHAIFAGFDVQADRLRQHARQNESQDVASLGRNGGNCASRNARDQKCKESLPRDIAMRKQNDRRRAPRRAGGHAADEEQIRPCNVFML
jgi:hypothetical protein